MAKFLHNVVEYAHTNKETKEEEHHKRHQPSINRPQCRVTNDAREHSVPVSIRDTVSISHEGGSQGVKGSNSGEIESGQDPADKGKGEDKEIEVDVHPLSGALPP